MLNLQPEVIVFYYMTESFLRSEVKHYIKSGYKIISHIFSNAKTTFKLSEWSISQVIFDKTQGSEITKSIIKADRYELEKNSFKFIKTYDYDILQPKLLEEIKFEKDTFKKKKNSKIFSFFIFLFLSN